MNKNLEDLYRDMGVEILFKYSGPRLTQCIGNVGCKFQAIYDQIWAMLSCAKLQDEIKHGIWSNLHQQYPLFKRHVEKE